MADRVRVGAVGTSWFAETRHLASLVSHPEAELTGICGRNREWADSVAADHNIPHVYTDYPADDHERTPRRPRRRHA
jgi:predicted dehydrogenase